MEFRYLVFAWKTDKNPFMGCIHGDIALELARKMRCHCFDSLTKEWLS